MGKPKLKHYRNYLEKAALCGWSGRGDYEIVFFYLYKVENQKKSNLPECPACIEKAALLQLAHTDL